MPMLKATDSTVVLRATMTVQRMTKSASNPDGELVDRKIHVEMNAVYSASGEKRYGDPHFTAEENINPTEGEKRALLEQVGLTAPVNVDVPHVYQQDNRLLCTMGNWEENLQPDTYAYLWQKDGQPTTITTPEYALEDGEMGTFSCTVTATNRVGSTDIVSNELVVGDAVRTPKREWSGGPLPAQQEDSSREDPRVYPTFR